MTIDVNICDVIYVETYPRIVGQLLTYVLHIEYREHTRDAAVKYT